MILEEINYKFYGLAALCVEILKSYNADTQEGLAKLFGIVDGKSPEHVRLSFTRIIADREFLVVKETIIDTLHGPTIQLIAMAASSALGTFHSFNATTDAGLPPSSMLRVNGAGVEIKHATLKIEVSNSIKTVYYGKEFITTLVKNPC